MSTENHELEIEIEQRSEIPEQEQKERKKSIKDIETFADRLYLKRKIKECDEKVSTLKKSRQAAVDYFRAQLQYQETHVQVEKIKGIIESVKEEYQREIDIKTMEKDQYEEKLRMLDNNVMKALFALLVLFADF